MADTSDDVEEKKLLKGRVPNPWYLKKGDSFDLDYYKGFLAYESRMMTGDFQSFTIDVAPLPFELGEEEAQMESLATQKDRDQYEAALRDVDGLVIVTARFLTSTHLAVSLTNRTIVINIEVKDGKIRRIDKQRTL